MYWSPNLLAVVFKKQEILQQVVTRMHEFSKIFRGWYPGPQREGRPPSAPNTQHGRGRKPWSPQLFSRSCAPVKVPYPGLAQAMLTCESQDAIPLHWT